MKTTKDYLEELDRIHTEHEARMARLRRHERTAVILIWVSAALFLLLPIVGWLLRRYFLLLLALALLGCSPK